MKNYKYIFIIALIIFIVPNIVNAAPADDACKNKKNGDSCSYSTSGRGAQSGSTTSGFCDRTNGDSNATKNPLTCRSGDAWGDRCAVLGDACLGTTSTPGQRGTSTTTGTCANLTTPAGPRTPARTSMICDTSVKPPGNPGGRSSAGSSPGGANTGSGNTGGGETSPGGANTGSAGGNTTPTDATAPQTVGFINPIRFNSLTELIAGIINALLGILGAITVAILVMSGFKYMTSSNPGEVGQALDGIKNAVVGLMIIMGAFLITQYVISALAV